MSKVVHLSDPVAIDLLEEYCRLTGMGQGAFVSTLIKSAIAEREAELKALVTESAKVALLRKGLRR